MERFLGQSGYTKDADTPFRDVPLYGGPGGPRFTWIRYRKGQLSIDVSMVSNVSARDFILSYASLTSRESCLESRFVELTERDQQHCTAPMDFFDGISLVVAFPQHTFSGRFLKNVFTPTARLEHGIQKYLDRGYKPVRLTNAHGEVVDKTLQDEVWEVRRELKPDPGWRMGDPIEAGSDLHTLQVRLDQLVNPPWVLRLNSEG